jgi:hypothetical protein
MAVDFDMMRKRIAQNVYDNDRNSLGFDTCSIFWNADMEEWLMVYNNEAGVRCASFWDSVEDHLACVADEEIQNWYDEYLADDYDDIEDEAA